MTYSILFRKRTENQVHPNICSQSSTCPILNLQDHNNLPFPWLKAISRAGIRLAVEPAGDWPNNHLYIQYTHPYTLNTSSNGTIYGHYLQPCITEGLKCLLSQTRSPGTAALLSNPAAHCNSVSYWVHLTIAVVHSHALHTS